MKKHLSLVILCLALSPAFLAAQETEMDTFEEKIIEMMDLSGATTQFELIIDQMVDMYQRNERGRVKEGFWEELKAEMKKDGFKELYDILIPVYKKHLTEEEVDAAIAFYSTEAGRSLVEKMPLITQESMQAGAQWGARLGEKIARKMEDARE